MLLVLTGSKLSGWLVAIALVAVPAVGQNSPAGNAPSKGGVISRVPKREKENPNARSVEGKVLNPDGTPVAHAVVQIKDAGDIRSFITQEDGTYRFSGLSKDIEYELKANLGDRTTETKRLTVFDNRRTATINLTFEK